MKILGLIPARGGSKGVPGKNIKILAGKPLIQYTIESALQSTLLTDVIVSTDNEEIAGIARELRVEVPFLRPASLSTDIASSLDVAIHSIDFLSESGRKYDAVCLLQPTCPFRKNGFIDEAIRKFIETGCDSLVSVLPVPLKYNPHWIFEIHPNGYLRLATGEDKIIPRRQDLPDAYLRDGSVYLTKTTIIKTQRSLYGKSICYVISKPGYDINIDTMEDWLKAENYLKSKK